MIICLEFSNQTRITIMCMALSVVMGLFIGASSLVSVAAKQDLFHVEHRVACSRKKICNGNLMCAFVCESGTAETNAWTDSALAYQRRLQRDDPLVVTELPSTHNSAISEAYGYGIEKYFISALGGGLDTNQGDDVGTGVCQHLTLVDQLNMGIRHLEVDVWWGPKQDLDGKVHDGKGDLVVCHSPVPLYPVGEIQRQAEAAGLNLQFDAKNMSCIGTKRLFVDVLTEIKDWMMLEKNKEEFVMLYIDTKMFITEQKYIDQGNVDILAVFGREMVFAPADGDPLQMSIADMAASGKRVILENQKTEWLNPSEGEALVFAPVLWKHQFNTDDLVEYPNCTVEGDSDWYGKAMVRALGASGTTEAGTRCGVNLVSSDYTNPDDMKMFVWSWDQKEPTHTGVEYCTAMLPSGRWASMDCTTPLPAACMVALNGDTQPSVDTARATWSVDLNMVSSWSAAACPAGFEFGAPHNGFTNAILNTVSYGQTIWLNTPLTL